MVFCCDLGNHPSLWSKFPCPKEAKKGTLILVGTRHAFPSDSFARSRMTASRKDLEQ
jgi:hypothetical protein